MILLDHTIEAPDGSDISFGYAHFHEGGYAGVNVSGSWDQAGSGSLTYWCEWEDLDQFIYCMIGQNTVEDDGVNTRYSRFLPHKYPIRCAKNLWGTRISNIKGIPGEGTADGEIVQYPIISEGLIEYRYAAVTVEYESCLWTMQTDEQTPYDKEWQRFTTVVKTPRLDYIQTRLGIFHWIEAPPKPDLKDRPAMDSPLPLREQSVDYIVTLHRCPEPFRNPLDYIGYANSNAQFLAGQFQLDDEGFDINTIQLMGVGETIKPVAFTEDILYDHHLYFQYRPNGFDKVRWIRPTSVAYNAFSLDGLVPTTNATRAVPTADLAALFLPN